MTAEHDHQQELFRALSDTTRRAILDLLAEREPMTVSEIAAHFPNLVRSGISKHLMELRRLNLVADEKRGRERYYSINPESIKLLLYPWVAKYEKYWNQRLQKLKSVAEVKIKKHDENR